MPRPASPGRPGAAGGLQVLLDSGATAAAIGHDPDGLRHAGYAVDMGPGGGEEGGRIAASGTPAEIRGNEGSITGRLL